MSLSRIRVLLLLGTCVGCTPEPQPVDDPGEAEASELSGAIDIPPMVRKNLGITFAPVEVRDVERTLRVPGAFELEPLARQEYGMSLPGHVEYFVDQFDRVEEGQDLYRFQSPSWPELLHEILEGESAIRAYEAEIEVGRARLLETERRLASARERIEVLGRADFKRADLTAELSDLEAILPRLRAEITLTETRLAGAHSTREHALHRAAAASGLAEDELDREVLVDGESVHAYETIDWIVVKARQAGVVEALGATEGAFVEPPSLVLTVVDPDRLRFHALALQADLPLLQGTDRARIVPPQGPGRAPQDYIEASFSLGLEAHPEERTLTLLARPRGTAPWVRTGVSAFLEVVLEGTGSPALAIPRSAIVQDGLTHVFFRRDPADPNRALRVEADMGVSDGRWVELMSGVMQGDEVVLEGAYELKLATQESPGSGKGGHFHADGSFHGDE